LNKCYNYLTSTQIANAKIVEGKKETDTGFVYDKSVNIGDVIKIDTGYQGKITGFVESQKYSLNGGILVKDSSIHLEGQSGGLNSEPQLPSKYKKLQYIEATGEQYIDADYLFLSDQKPYRIKVDFELTQMPYTMNLFGVALNADNRYPLIVLVNSQKQFLFAHYGFSGSAVAFADGDYNRHIIEYVFDEGVYFDGIIQQNTVEQAKNSYNAYIEQADWTNPSFGIFTTIRGDAEYTERRAFAKIYSFEFWNDIGLERKYIPAQRKSDGTIGLFELYTQTFFTNQGEGKFIGG
jgi:hypothetical protein